MHVTFSPMGLTHCSVTVHATCNGWILWKVLRNCPAGLVSLLKSCMMLESDYFHCVLKLITPFYTHLQASVCKRIPTFRLLIVHCLYFTFCVMSQARKRSPLTTTTDKPSWEVNKKSNMLVFFVVRLWGGVDEVSVVVSYDTQREMKRSIVASDAYWSFLRLPGTLRLPDRAIIGLILCSLIST